MTSNQEIIVLGLRKIADGVEAGKYSTEDTKYEEELERCTEILDRWLAASGCNGLLQVSGHLSNILGSLEAQERWIKTHEEKAINIVLQKGKNGAVWYFTGVEDDECRGLPIGKRSPYKETLTTLRIMAVDIMNIRSKDTEIPSTVEETACNWSRCKGSNNWRTGCCKGTSTMYTNIPQDRPITHCPYCGGKIFFRS